MKQFIVRLCTGKVKVAMPRAAHVVHKGEHFFHLSYLSAVSVEAHGFYRYFAMGLATLIVAGFFIVEDASPVIEDEME